MAQENTQSDYQEVEFNKRARRRLVGSIALVLLMIVLLPMVLEDKHQEPTNPNLVISIPNEQSTVPMPNSEPAASPASPSDNAGIEDLSQAEATPEKPAVVDQNETNGSAIQVQVGVFSDSANVKQIQSKLENNGFKVQTNAYATGKIRIRVGPYNTKADADAAIAKLQTLKFNPMIVHD